MRRRESRTTIFPIALAALLTGCASQGPTRTPAALPPPVPRPTAGVYFYPLHGQSAEQQGRDRYECHLWAHRRTGYEPSQPHQSSDAPVQVTAVPPPGYGVAAGAAADASRQQEAERIEAQENALRAQGNAQLDAAVIAYRDAMKTCLSTRGYAVQ